MFSVYDFSHGRFVAFPRRGCRVTYAVAYSYGETRSRLTRHTPQIPSACYRKFVPLFFRALVPFYVTNLPQRAPLRASRNNPPALFPSYNRVCVKSPV